MTKQELKQNGFVVITNLQVILALIPILFTMGGAIYGYGSLNNRVDVQEKRVDKFEQVLIDHQKEQIESVGYRNLMLQELKYNLKTLCEKQGINYKELVK